MVDASQIVGLVQSIKATSDIVKAMLEIRDAHAFQIKANELLREVNTAYERAFAAQSAHLELTERVRQLEAEKREAENWAAEKDRYALVEVYEGRLAYLVKDSARGAEPVHYICPACAQKAQKSILQADHGGYGQKRLACPSCGMHIVSGYEPISGPASIDL